MGHGVERHPWDVKAAPQPHMSKREQMRKEEDDMIEAHDVAANEGEGGATVRSS